MAQEECNELATKSSIPKADSKCQMCTINPTKYKCPRCFMRTCSLHCVNAHKESTDCNGKRKLTEDVPLDDFDDNHLISDYNLLEDAQRVAESAERTRVELCGDSQKRPLPLKSLQGAAASRRTKLRFLPNGMSKRQTNQAVYDKRTKVISWTIEWRFHSTDVVLLNHRVDENTSLSSVIMNHLQPGPFNHPLKRFCEEPLQSLNFFIRKFPDSKSPFVELDIEAPIREQLATLEIIEYPVVHVCLPSQRCDYEVTKVAIPHELDHKEFIKNREPSPKRVLFREEEIKEENSSDPKGLDVMKCVKREGTDQVSLQAMRTENKSTKALDNSSCAREGEQNGTKNDIFFDKALDEQLDFSANSTVADIIEKLDPELVQWLLGSCSDLISESNFDDFFNLEGVFPEELELLETNDLPNSCKELHEEELEEGEIPLHEEELEEGEIPLHEEELEEGEIPQ